MFSLVRLRSLEFKNLNHKLETETDIDPLYLKSDNISRSHVFVDDCDAL